MPVRPARYSDLLPASKMFAEAFKEGSITGQYAHPYRDKYPNDMYLFFLNWCRVAYATGLPDYRVIVTYPAVGQEDKMTGFAIWQRFRSQPLPSSQSLVPSLRKMAMQWYNYAGSFVYPNRALEPSRASFLKDVDPFIKHHWTSSRADCWSLDLIAVDPASGGQGYGRQLVEYGLELAGKESVSCSVIAGAGKVGFYKACGFHDEVGTLTTEGGEANPMVRLGVKGGTILFWDGGREVKGLKKYGEA